MSLQAIFNMTSQVSESSDKGNIPVAINQPSVSGSSKSEYDKCLPSTSKSNGSISLKQDSIPMKGIKSPNKSEGSTGGIKPPKTPITKGDKDGLVLRTTKSNHASSKPSKRDNKSKSGSDKQSHSSHSSRDNDLGDIRDQLHQLMKIIPVVNTLQKAYDNYNSEIEAYDNTNIECPDNSEDNRSDNDPGENNDTSDNDFSYFQNISGTKEVTSFPINSMIADGIHKVLCEGISKDLNSKILRLYTSSFGFWALNHTFIGLYFSETSEVALGLILIFNRLRQKS